MEKRGRISSPGYPGNYPNSMCKRWYIQAAEGDVITISILEMGIEVGDDHSCNRDYLEIGPNPRKKFCGEGKKPYPFIIKGKHAVITFQSDRFTSYKGFLLKYISGPVPAPYCLSDEFRCKNGKCIYSDWRCNGVDECGDNSDEKSCPTHTNPPPVSCSDGIFCLGKGSGDGYMCVNKAQICDGKKDCLLGDDESNCGKEPGHDIDDCQNHFHNLTGTIHSPLYPKDYPSNRDCMWTIHMASVTDKVQVRFVDFNIQLNENTDYVEVYDGKDLTKKALIGRYYGMHRPPSLIESSTNWLKIKFHSDGSYGEKGFNLTFQRKGTCLSDQLPCGLGELDCFQKNQRCDDNWDCRQQGGDELSCGICHQMYSCGKRSSQCYDMRHRCNGVGHCTNMADELNCSPTQCGSHNGTFLCDNKKCIYETWKCDKTDDCGDSSDEQRCIRSTNLIIIAAVVGSLVCGLLLVVALGCTCKLYNLRMHQHHGPRHETPLSRLYAEFLRRRAPPTYHEAMLTSRPYEEVRREYLDQLNSADQGTQNQERRRSGRRSSRTRSRQQNQGGTTDQSVSGTVSCDRAQNDAETSANVPLSQNSSGHSASLERHSSTTALLQNDCDSKDSSESELESPRRDRVRVHFSNETAQFQRNSPSHKEGSSSSDLSAIPHSSTVPAGDATSIDTATIASLDSVDISKIDTHNNPDDILHSTSVLNSDGNSLQPRRLLTRSSESLDSTGSDNIWGDFTATES
ncbi:hypothetical protein FSP39_006043 [Pinctada imbricata]|uniref:CUB domain-containing protein n=1 Tax=Pinctada imbricata TaxID=66713 RepID=A0AA88XHZ6_PINIB|nr:hypothetical protein FSP39_006043 [Pinctada imbricata]